MPRKKSGDSDKKYRELRLKIEELKRPLTTSLGAVNFLLLKGAGPLSEQQQRFLEVAKKNLEKLFSEIQKFRDSAK